MSSSGNRDVLHRGWTLVISSVLRRSNLGRRLIVGLGVRGRERSCHRFKSWKDHYAERVVICELSVDALGAEQTLEITFSYQPQRIRMTNRSLYQHTLKHDGNTLGQKYLGLPYVALSSDIRGCWGGLA
jgi:hypothetical protein